MFRLAVSLILLQLNQTFSYVNYAILGLNRKASYFLSFEGKRIDSGARKPKLRFKLLAVFVTK